jgi:hypothetical protein
MNVFAILAYIPPTTLARPLARVVGGVSFVI